MSCLGIYPKKTYMLGDNMKSSGKDTSFVHISWPKIDGLVQERRNSSALAIGLSLPGFNPSICKLSLLFWFLIIFQNYCNWERYAARVSLLQYFAAC